MIIWTQLFNRVNKEEINMYKKYSRKILLSSLMAFCSGINVNAMQTNKVAKNNSSAIENQSKGFGAGTLAISNAAFFTIGGLAGYFGAQKSRSIQSVVKENIKLRSENEDLKLKQKTSFISKEDYDKKVEELGVKIVEANNKIKDLEKKLSAPPDDPGDDPAKLKETIAALKNQLKVFTDVWGDSSDDDKMKKMKALHEWRYGKKEYRSYDWFINRGLQYLNGCMPDKIKLDKNYKTMSEWLVTGINGSPVGNWITNDVVPAAKEKPGGWYHNAMRYLKAQLEDLKDSLTGTK